MNLFKLMRLYKELLDDKYSKEGFERLNLGEGMEVINQLIDRWWKPRYIINHNDKCAFEWMSSSLRLLCVRKCDIDWHSTDNLPERAIKNLQEFSAQFPMSIYKFKDGIAEVSWQLLPDGRYWRDSEGYGMTDDEEITLYGFIDHEANVVVRFQYLTKSEVLNNKINSLRKHYEDIEKYVKELKDNEETERDRNFELSDFTKYAEALMRFFDLGKIDEEVLYKGFNSLTNNYFKFLDKGNNMVLEIPEWFESFISSVFRKWREWYTLKMLYLRNPEVFESPDLMDEYQRLKEYDLDNWFRSEIKLCLNEISGVNS